jgi:hypothetical protein
MAFANTFQIILVSLLIIELVVLFVLLAFDTNGCRDRVASHVHHVLQNKKQEDEVKKAAPPKLVHIEAYKNAVEYD